MANTNRVETGSRKSAPILPPRNDDKISAKVTTAAGILAGTWALQKFPKITIIGLIGVGVLIGMTMKEVARSVERFPRRKPEELH